MTRVRAVGDAVITVIGWVLIVSGLLHFAVPRPFRAISKPLFGKKTSTYVKINGASEAAIGLALTTKQTRVAGLAGLAAYGVYLGDRIVAYGWRRFGNRRER
ncbi:hypothetical protein [Gordonia crocea]|uniref:DUF4267 domain-containing protein n=1 Tax=Gordonia crocea TaxID=589162 RepID=A0A7M3SVH4_9ACTN|nr:hypothetical protein [Gordonia crocea]GED96648.1 hypothetical protein nbrc107697_06870 [Gordonia crocea]